MIGKRISQKGTYRRYCTANRYNPATAGPPLNIQKEHYAQVGCREPSPGCWVAEPLATLLSLRERAAKD
jgi:hypothetical protein